MAGKTELLRFLDQRVFNPILKAKPRDYNESQRGALADVQGSTKSEKARFHGYRNAQEICTTTRAICIPTPRSGSTPN